MHFKKLIRKSAALGLAVCLSMTNLSVVSAAAPTTAPVEKQEVTTDTMKQDEKKSVDANENTQGNTDNSIQKNEADVVTSEKQNNAVTVTPTPTEIPKEENVPGGQVKPEVEEKVVVSKAEFTDKTEKKYTFELSNCKVAQDEKLVIDVWSVTNGKDDLKRIPLKKKSEGVYGAEITVADFKNAGDYTVKAIKVKSDKSETVVQESKFVVKEMVSGEVTIVQDTFEKGTARLKITVPEVPSGIKKVEVAIWSKENQSDLHWYSAVYEKDGWYIDMDIAKHTYSWSKYVAHVYAEDGNGFRKFVGGTRKLDFSIKDIPVEVKTDIKKGIATIEIDSATMKVPGELSSITCAVWSDVNGQDDLVWHDLKYSIFSKKWYKEIPLTTLKGLGKCYAHVYGTKINKEGVFLGGKQFEVTAPSAEKVEGIVTDNELGKFKIKIQNVKSMLGTKEIRVALWCNQDQSDLKWYTAKQTTEGCYEIESDILSHRGNIGIYQAHVYLEDNVGIKTYIGGTAFGFDCKIGAITVEKDPKETRYKVKIPVKKCPGKIKEVNFGVWSNANGQDDLKWYTATPNGDVYEAVIDIKNHRTLGSYAVHAYGKNMANQKIMLYGNNALFEVKETVKGKIRVTNINESKGTAKINLTDIKAVPGVSAIEVAVWSEKNQSDLKWYKAEKKDATTWTVDMDIKNHNYHGGTYVAHAYATMGNEIRTMVAGASYKINPKDFVYVSNNLGHGRRTLGITGPSKTENLKFGVWSEANGQDDLKWYDAKELAGNTWTATLLGYEHKSGGTFNVHVYSGTQYIGGTTFWLDKSEVAKHGWYYEKLNGKTYKLYYIDGKLQKNLSNIIGRQSSYMAEINRTTCTVTIYAKDGANGYIIPVIAFTCSVGLPATPTPVGRFHTIQKYRWAELMGPSYGQYCTRIVGGILFHSVAGSNMTSYNIHASNYNMLGRPASHGCVRLCVRDAKWIYDNCKLGMEVNIFDNPYPGPFGKPATIKIPVGQNWDPTDPNV